MTEPSLEGWVVHRVLEQQAARHPDRIYVVPVGQPPVTFGELDERASRIANGLARLGVGRGDHVLVMMRNSVDFIALWCGISRAGAVFVPINVAFRGGFLEYLINDSGGAVLAVDREFLPALAPSLPKLGALRTVVVASNDGADITPLGHLRRVDFAELLAASAAQPEIAVSYRDLAAILYTSGTTGRSKGVLLPHGHLRLDPHIYIDRLGLTDEDVFYCCLPLFHANGLLLQAYGALILGARLILARGFSASGWLDDIRRHGATVTNLLGAMTEFVHAQPPRPDGDRSSLRVICAVPIPPAFGAEFERRFGVKLVELYGNTESNCPIFMSAREPMRPGSCGRVMSEWFECRIADPETDEELPDGTAGELLIRPTRPWTFMLGYHGMPEETARAWRNFWFHSGDALKRDADGYYYFIDRLKDCIRRRGENISSYEVEQAVLSHPAVAEVAVVGVPSPFQANEQEVKASVVLAPGQVVTPEALLDHCRARMPDFALPRCIEFLDALPKTATQKVQKQTLRESGLGPETWISPDVARTAARRRSGGAAS